MSNIIKLKSHVYVCCCAFSNVHQYIIIRLIIIHFVDVAQCEPMDLQVRYVDVDGDGI